TRLRPPAASPQLDERAIGPLFLGAYAGQRNAIELMPAHRACRSLEVALPILRGADVALQGQAAFRQELRELAWFDPERQLLAGLRQRSEQPLRADEGIRPREHIAVNV